MGSCFPESKSAQEMCAKPYQFMLTLHPSPALGLEDRETSCPNGSPRGCSPTLEQIHLVVKEAGNGLDRPGSPSPNP